MKNAVRSLLAGVCFFGAQAAMASVPTNIYFDNQTDIAVDAFTAGNPGASIPAGVSNFPVPYIGVMARCNIGGVPNACPIEFYTNDGKLFASVILNVNTATVSTEPQFFGEFVGQYDISGWEASPVEHITITPAA